MDKAMGSYFSKNRGKSGDSEPRQQDDSRADAQPGYKSSPRIKTERKFNSDFKPKTERRVGAQPWKSDSSKRFDAKPRFDSRPRFDSKPRFESKSRFDSKPRYNKGDRDGYARSNEAPTPEAELIFGIRPIIEAIESGKEIDKVLISRDTEGELAKELKSILRDRDIPFQMVPVEKLNRVTRKNHQGVLAYISPIEYSKLENVLTSTFEKGEVPLILILDRITDVRNFGAIVRSAECAGAHAIVIPSKGAAQINADALKTSAGALHLVPICRANQLFQVVKFLQDSGVKVIASTEKTTHELYESDFRVPTAFILGSEDEGIEQELIDAADEACMIPLHGKIKSLNVSVAASVMLYEAVRQRISITV